MDEEFLPRREVEKLTGQSRSTIYAKMAAGTFPKPVPIDHGGSVRWLKSEIKAWQAARIAARNGAGSKAAA